MQDIQRRLYSLLGREVPGFDPKKPLLDQFDSLQIFHLIPLIEKEFGVDIFSIEITSSAFRSVENLAELLAKKSLDTRGNR